MEYVVQPLKISRNLVHAETNARSPKTGFYAASYNSNSISLRDYRLILCMLGCLHKLQYKIRKLIPKGP